MPESYFSITTSQEVFGMDATVSITRNLDSSVTESPVEDGGFATDNIVNMGDVISMRGVISDINTLGATKNTDKVDSSFFIQEIERARAAKELVSVNVGLYNSSSDNTSLIYRTIPNCAIVSASFTQNEEFGIANDFHNSYSVALRFKKVRIIDRPDISVKTVAIPYEDATVEVEPTPQDKTTKTRVGNIGEIDKDTGAFIEFDFNSDDPRFNPDLRE